MTLREGTVLLGNVKFTNTFSDQQVVVPVHRNLQGLRVVLRMPESCEFLRLVMTDILVSLDEEPCVVLDIKTGSQPLKAARVAVTPLDELVTYLLDKANAEGHALELSPTSIGLGDVAANSEIQITIPYAGVPRNELARVRVVADFESEAGRAAQYLDQQSVYMGLPITVNVHDFFRPNA